jgi:predicted ester cyclase
MVAEGDLVAFRWIGRATHLGRYHEIEPTGRSMTVTAISVSRVRDGRICEDWIEFDEFGLRRQLGAFD